MLSKGLELSDYEIGKRYDEIANIISMPKYFYEKISDKVKEIVISKNKNVQIMEYGSGNGYLGEKILLKTGKKINTYNLVDNSELLLKNATERLSSVKSDTIINSFHQSGNENIIGIPEKTMDLVISTEVLEHLKNPEKYLENIYQVLKDDGLVLISIPNGSAFEPYQTRISEKYGEEKVKSSPFLLQFIHGEHPWKTPQPIATMYYYDELVELLTKKFNIKLVSGFEHHPYAYDIFRRYLFPKLRLSKFTSPIIDKIQLMFDGFISDPSKYYRTYFILEKKI